MKHIFVTAALTQRKAILHGGWLTNLRKYPYKIAACTIDKTMAWVNRTAAVVFYWTPKVLGQATPIINSRAKSFVPRTSSDTPSEIQGLSQ